MTLRSRARIVTGVLGEATIRELEIGLTGSVVGPGDPSYETARRVWNSRHRQTAGADRPSRLNRGCGARGRFCPK